MARTVEEEKMKPSTRILPVISLLFAVLLVGACSSSYDVYRRDLWHGKNLFMEERYAEARDMFVKAAGEQNRAAPLAYAGTVNYKLGDIAAAGRYIGDAEMAPGRGFLDMRILAYKSLALFKQGKKQEGMDALRDYLDYYSCMYPLVTIDDVESMWKSGQVDLPALEKLLDAQVATYDRDMYLDFFASIGYYGRRFPGLLPGGFMPD
jgi:hypothetical protein